MVSWACLAMSPMGFFIIRAVFRRRTDLAVYLGCFGLGLICFLRCLPKTTAFGTMKSPKLSSLNDKAMSLLCTMYAIFAGTTPTNTTFIGKLVHIAQASLKVLMSSSLSVDLKKSCIQWQVLALKMGANLAFPLKFAKSRTRVFRQFELGLVAGDEKDLIYTRINVRGEDVYIYPVNLSKQSIQKLFLLYLEKGKELNHGAKW